MSFLEIDEQFVGGFNFIITRAVDDYKLDVNEAFIDHI